MQPCTRRQFARLQLQQTGRRGWCRYPLARPEQAQSLGVGTMQDTSSEHQACMAPRISIHTCTTTAGPASGSSTRVNLSPWASVSAVPIGGPMGSAAASAGGCMLCTYSLNCSRVIGLCRSRYIDNPTRRARVAGVDAWQRGGLPAATSLV